MIKIKTKNEIEIMKQGGAILAKIMKELEKEVRPGITTKYLEQITEKLILEHNAKCSFKGYNNFPSCLCASVNEEIVHCVPSERILKNGDIISLDLGICYQGFHTDMAISLGVGNIAPETLRLIKVTKKALKKAIKKVRAGNSIADIGNTIQKYVESQGFNVVRDLCGHGIGLDLHEDPQIFNYKQIFKKNFKENYRGKNSDLTIKEGMVLCIEPMVTIGDWKLKKTLDGFGFQTIDNSLSCHFEHTIAVTKAGPLVLTAL